MTIRDLGYLGYDGPRRPPNSTMAILGRETLSRAWRSLLVKLALLFAWVPGAICALGFVLASDQVRAEPDAARGLLSGVYVALMFLFALPIALVSGARLVAEDREHGTFAFVFSRPVTPWRYTIGRWGALTLLLAVAIALSWFPSVGGAITVVPRSELAGEVASRIPTLLGVLVTGAGIASVSLACSALHRRRSVTMGAFIVVIIAPYIVGAVVNNSADSAPFALISVMHTLEYFADVLLSHPLPEGLSASLVSLGAAAWVALPLVFTTHRIRDLERLS